MFWTLGGFVYRRRRWVVAAWLVALVALMPLGASLPKRLDSGGWEVPGSDSRAVQDSLAARYPGLSIHTELMVVHSSTLTADDAAFKAKVTAAREELLRQEHVTSVADPYSTGGISPDGHTAIATMQLEGSQGALLDSSGDRLDAVQRAEGDGVSVDLTGMAPAYKAFQRISESDLQSAEMFSIPLALLILVVVFGSLVAAGVPVVLALSGLFVTFGTMAAMTYLFPISLYAQNLAMMIGLGAGIDYSLFLVTRYRAELAAGRSIEDALRRTVSTAGRAVAISAITVAIAVSGLFLVSIPAFRTMGVGLIGAVVFACLAALTLVPATLALIGRRVDRFSVHFWSRGKPKQDDVGMWHRWARAVMARPWPALLVSAGVIVVLAIPVTRLNIGSTGISVLPPDEHVRVATELVREAFGAGAASPVFIEVEDAGGVDAAMPAVAAIVERLEADAEVQSVQSIAGIADRSGSPLISSDGKATIILATTKHSEDSPDAAGLIDRIREQIAPAVAGTSGVLVGGGTANSIDSDHELAKKLPVIVAIVLALSFVTLLLAFRAPVLAFKAMIMNLGSVLAAYGIIVLIFQDGHLAGLLNFDANGQIDSWIPVILFSVLFGLSMDYEVFLLSRIREEYLASGDNATAVANGLEHTARLITAAALIMVTVFAGFAMSGLLPMKAMGTGLAVAVALDATLVRLVLVPSLMELMGKWNWWMPGHLDRLLPRIDLGEAEPAQASGAGGGG